MSSRRPPRPVAPPSPGGASRASDSASRDAGSRETALSAGERSLLDALRRPGRRSVRAETTDSGLRGLEVEEVIAVEGSPGGTLALVGRLLAEAPFRDITIRQADGRIVALRRVLRARFPT